MIPQITEAQYDAVKKSFFNILAFLLEHENIESKYLRCVLKWGLQLDLNKEDLVISNMDISQISFTEPREKMESLFHLSYLIYLDNLVEDVELEVASLYAQRLGFSAELVRDLFEFILTLGATKKMPHNLQEEIEAFINSHKA
jgi:hypothetical protein